MPERLTDRLVELDALDQEGAEAALDRQVLQGGALDTSLLELGLVDEPTILDALGDAYALPVAKPEQVLAPPDLRALRTLPEPWAKKHGLAPLSLSADGTALEVLSPGPPDIAVLRRLSDLLELTIDPVLAPEFRVWQRLARLYEVEPPARFAELIGAVEIDEQPPSPAPVASEPAAPAPEAVLREPEAASTGSALTFSEAVNLLRDAQDRDEIVRIALRYARKDLELVAVFINHEDHLEGWLGAGPGAEHLPHVKVELTPHSAFRVVLDTQAHYLGPVPSDPGHDKLLERLGRDKPRGVLIVPVRIRNRTIALLYGDNGAEPIPTRLAADLMLFTTHLQMALEGLLMRRKAESLSEIKPAEPEPAPLEPAEVTDKSEAPAVRPELVEAVERAVDEIDPSLDLTPLDLEDETDSGPAPSAEDAPPSAPSRDDTQPDDPPAPPEATSEDETDPAVKAPAEPEPRDDIVIEDPVESEDLEPVPEEVAPEPEPIPAELAELPIEEPEPEPDATPKLLTRSSSWAQATLLPAEPEEDIEASHPLIEEDEEWEDVSAPDIGAQLDASISAAQDALHEESASGVFDREALAAAEDGEALLEELDELTSSLEEALAKSEATSPADPTTDAPDEELDADVDTQQVSVPPLASDGPQKAEDEDGWEEVDVDGWAGTPKPAVGPIPEPPSHQAARASLTEDATLPDLSAEAWIRASSEIVRSRPLPPEVMEAAARPEAPEPVPLTRITIGRQRTDSSGDLQEVHNNRAQDDRYDHHHTAPPQGTTPILLGEPEDEAPPIPLTPADRRGPEQPVPLTRRASGAFAAPMPAGGGLEAEIDAEPAGPGTLRPMPAPTQPVSQAQVRAARVEHEATQLRAQLEHGDRAERTAAAEALVSLGPDALPYLSERFPGPTSLDPFLPDADLPSFAKCGPLLSVLERFGRDAHPHVAKYLDAPGPHQRFFATYFFGAVYVPEAIPRLIQRLHDEEPRICMLAARTLFSYREHPDFAVVLDHLHGRLGASSAIARRHAAYLLGLFRDVTAIPKLIDFLDRKDKGMVDVAEDALAEITKQRFNGSTKKWNGWWTKNRHRSRLAWLVDGLAAKDADLRRSAAEELRAVTGLDMGFDENAPKRQREEARQRWIAWWREQELAG